MFERDRYYSLTEIQKKFKISRFKLSKLLDEHKPPVIENKITYGAYYSLTAKYYLIEDIDSIFIDSKVADM
ncbi:hypothetical protein [Mucilaginibacter sp.]|uniref:hypothetical protein n=1 Tax=Mucilaginibacter sp. TaxID=1882438 RepID=UPI003D1001C4